MRHGRELAPLAVVIIVPILVFARAVPYDFVRSWDDGRFISDNPDALHVSWPALVRIFSTVRFEAYQPLHLLSYWLDVPWFGPAPAVVHAVNLALWVLGLTSFYALLRALALPAWVCAWCTLLAGIHPAQVETVSWATGRKDVLALLFVTSSLRLQLKSTRAWDTSAWLARALYLAALLSKTTSLPLPVFGLCLDVWGRGKSLRSAVQWQLPSFAFSAVVSAAVLTIWREHALVRTTLGSLELAPLRFAQTLGHQWLMALWPSSNSPMYSTHRVGRVELAASLACAAYALSCFISWRRRAGLGFVGLAGFGLWLLPVSNLVPLYFPLQDRYASFPLFALALGIAGWLAERARSNRAPDLQWLAALGVLCLGLRTFQYAGVWQSELRLWGHAVRTQPDAEYAFLKLGEVRRDASDFEGAIAAYRGAVLLAPGRKLAHAGLFEVVARRDERYQRIAVPRARELALQYYARLDQPRALRAFAGELGGLGYVRALELPLHMWLAYEPQPETALTQAASSALAAGQTTLARFYVHELRHAPDSGPLAALYAEPYLRVLP